MAPGWYIGEHIFNSGRRFLEFRNPLGPHDLDRDIK